MKRFDVVALGELLIDFTQNGLSGQGNMMMEANPGGAPCNVLAMLQKLGKKTAFVGKVGDDFLGKMLAGVVADAGINTDNLKFDRDVHTTLAFVHTYEDGDRDFSFYRNPGADIMLSADEVDERCHVLQHRRLWLLQRRLDASSHLTRISGSLCGRLWTRPMIRSTGV